MAVLSFCMLLSAVAWGQTSTTVETVTENLTLSEPGEYHITATEGCIADGVTIDITSKDAWLFFDNLRPSQVIGQWLSKIKVDGEAAGHKRNVFVNIYGNGAGIKAPEGTITFGYYMTLQVIGDNGGGDNRFMYGYTTAANLTIGLVSIPIIWGTKKLFDRFDPEAEF